jgi:hypothetical protein
MRGKVRLATLPGAVVGLGLLLAVVLAVAGPVPLLTASDDGCYLWHTTGTLIAIPMFGTAIVTDRGTAPVQWPKGYTARRSLGQVEVLDRAGHVVARTGQWYYLPGGPGGLGWQTCRDGVSTSWPTSRPPTPTAVPRGGAG